MTCSSGLEPRVRKTPRPLLDEQRVQALSLGGLRSHPAHGEEVFAEPFEARRWPPSVETTRALGQFVEKVPQSAGS